MNWLNRFLFLILKEALLVTLIGCLIFLSLVLIITRRAIPTICFLVTARLLSNFLRMIYFETIRNYSILQSIDISHFWVLFNSLSECFPAYFCFFFINSKHFRSKEQGQREESPRKVAAIACLIINNKRIITNNYYNLLIIDIYELLTHFQPMFHFYTPKNMMFSGV